MKKILAIATGVVLSVSAMAQGVLDFNNVVAGSPRITELGGGTAYLAGSAYKVDLYYGAVGADPSTFTSLNTAVPFNVSPQAGTFAGGQTRIPGFAPGATVVVQPRAWDASTGFTSWQTAYNTPGTHVSPISAGTVNVVLKNADANPPEVGVKLAGYVGHSLVLAPVPEPSTILLGLAGIGGLLFIRRKTA